MKMQILGLQKNWDELHCILANAVILQLAYNSTPIKKCIMYHLTSPREDIVFLFFLHNF